MGHGRHAFESVQDYVRGVPTKLAQRSARAPTREVVAGVGSLRLQVPCMSKPFHTEPFRAFTPDAPLELAADPIEQWLEWEEQANLIGFRITTQPVPLDVAAVPLDAVEVWGAAAAPPAITDRFLRGERALFPRHPLNRDPAVAFSGEPIAERWHCRFTSSRTLVVPAPPGAPLFSIKLATDHPHPDFPQPEKTRLREEVIDALEWVELMARIDGLLGLDPRLLVVREALAVLVPHSETGYLVRDLRLLQDGHHYLPAFSIPWVGRQIARRHGEDFVEFWGRHYAREVGCAKARLLARYGLQFETPNPQNVLVQLDADLHPTGRIVIRDLGDADCLTDARACREVPWTGLHQDLRPETRNSFWAFDEAGTHRVDPETVAAWCVRHDHAYFAELAARFPDAAPREATNGEAALAHWNRVLREPVGIAALACGFAKQMVGDADDEP